MTFKSSKWQLNGPIGNIYAVEWAAAAEGGFLSAFTVCTHHCPHWTVPPQVHTGASEKDNDTEDDKEDTVDRLRNKM